MAKTRFLLLAGAALALVCACSLEMVPPPPPTAIPPKSPAQAAQPTPTEMLATAAPTPSPTAAQTVLVYFTVESRLTAGIPPFEEAVTRALPPGADPVKTALDAYFSGPTPGEKARGLMVVTSGFTGWSRLEVSGGIARVTLAGTCFTNGAVYTIAGPLIRTLTQFPAIQYVKIYDAGSSTEQPDGFVNSIPVCLEP